MLMHEPFVAGGLAMSGLFDLEPIRLCYLNEKLGLDAEQARRNSPLHNLPARAAKLIVAYGADELPELKHQSRKFAAAWSARSLPVEVIEVTCRHHYAVLEQLAQPSGVLAKALAVSVSSGGCWNSGLFCLDHRAADGVRGVEVAQAAGQELDNLGFEAVHEISRDADDRVGDEMRAATVSRHATSRPEPAR
jgi:hypothetical protein